MKKAVLLGGGKATLIEAPDPHPIRDWAVVKVYAAPMCAEYKSFVSGGTAEFLGHEAAGEVVAVAQHGPVKLGDRVVVMPQYPCGQCPLCVAGDYIHCEHTFDFATFCGTPEGQATMAQYLLKPMWLLPRIPEGMSYDKASLACCALGPSFGAFQAMGLTAFDTVLITGAGPVGLGAVVNARFRGSRVLVAETVPYRVQRARELGAAHVVDPNRPDAVAQIEELTGGRGADCALDCAGNVAAQRFCIDSVRRKGKVAFVGECGDELPVRVSRDLLRKGITVTGVWHYNLNDFPRIMGVIQDSPVIDRLISHILPMSQIQDALELSSTHQTAKIILHPWE